MPTSLGHPPPFGERGRSAPRPWFLGIALAALGIALSPAGAQQKSYDHPIIEQSIRLLPDGDALVTDIRAYRFVGSFSRAELRLGTTGKYGTYDVEYLGVRDGVTGIRVPYETAREGNERVLRWTYRAANETRRFALQYRIRRAVQRYGDAAQFYWKAIEDRHAPIDRVRIVVTPPAASPTLFKVFVHSDAAPGELRIADDFRRVEVEQSNIPGTSFVELRVLLDSGVFPAAPVQTGQTYASLMADERRGVARGILSETGVIAGFAVTGLLVLALVLGYLVTYRRFGREPDVAYEGEYEREPPSDLPPAVVPAILTQGAPPHTAYSPAFAATLLQAARFGYLEIREQDEEHNFLGLATFHRSHLVYELTEKGRGTLAGRTVAPRPEDGPLHPFERDVLRAVFTQAGDGEKATSRQIEEWGKKISGRKSNFLHFVERWGPSLRAWFEKHHFKLDDARSERAKGAYIGAAVAAIVVSFLLSFVLPILTSLPILPVFVVGPVAGIMIAVAAKSLSRRTPEAAAEVKRWVAFKRFMTDFSALKDAGHQVLPIWEHYLVYATALGIADQLLKSLRLIAVEMHQTIPAPVWYHSSSFGSGSALGEAGFGALERMSRSFENFQNLSRSLSDSSRSGGGFSSSSSGGGGGGGGSSSAS